MDKMDEAFRYAHGMGSGDPICHDSDLFVAFEKGWNSSIAALAARATPAQPVPMKWPVALREAIAALYFDDSSDYQTALYAVVRNLSPELSALIESDDRADHSRAYHQVTAYYEEQPDGTITPVDPSDYARPSPSSLGDAIRAMPLPYVKVPPNGAQTQWGREMANCGAEVMREHIIALLPKLLFEAAAITKQVQQWVSVSDKMPPVGQEVIVYRPSDKYRKIDFDIWEEQYEAPLSEYPNNQIPIGLGWNENEFEEVTHWMPTLVAPIAHSE